MKTYYCNGLLKEVPYIIQDSENFFIQDFGPKGVDRYIYPGDSIKYELEYELVSLYDTLQNLYFINNDTYINDMYQLPIWVNEAGQNSDFNISAEIFQKFLNNENSDKIPNLYKHLYLADCQFLIGTIQNLLSSMEDAFIRYYVTLGSMNIDEIDQKEENCSIYVISETSRITSSLLETYFTKCYSILDLICKICYEIQNRNEDFSSYKKIKCSKILWGDRNRLTINEIENTLFEPCNLIRTIESLRNEAVHNGTWELNPKIFINFKNNMVEERYMLFPDMNEGRLQTVKNRKHFFSKRTKVNDILPIIHIEFKKRLLNTIKLLNKI